MEKKTKTNTIHKLTLTPLKKAEQIKQKQKKKSYQNNEINTKYKGINKKKTPNKTNKKEEEKEKWKK